ncbi:unnamed protein product, partial [Didymodactylos carnosus]
MFAVDVNTTTGIGYEWSYVNGSLPSHVQTDNETLIISIENSQDIKNVYKCSIKQYGVQMGEATFQLDNDLFPESDEGEEEEIVTTTTTTTTRILSPVGQQLTTSTITPLSSVRQYPNIRLTFSSTTSLVSSEDNLYVDCETDDPTAYVEWLPHVRRSLFVKDDYSQQSATLTFVPVTIDDEATYSCLSTNDRQTSVTSFSLKNLGNDRLIATNVEYEKPMTQTTTARIPPAAIVVLDEHEQRQLGDTLKIRCETNRNASDFRWTKADNEYQQLNIENDDVLVLNQLSFEQLGIYTCIVKNDVGESRKNITLTHNPDGIIEYQVGSYTQYTRSPPQNYNEENQQSNTNQEKEEDRYESTTIQTTVNGNSNDIGNGNVNGNGNSNDNGNWNGNGNGNGNGNKKPFIILKLNGTSEYHRGGDVQVHCETNTDNAVIRWKKTSGSPLSSTSNVVLDNKRLLIKEFDVHNFGTYTCVVQNEYGQSEKSVVLEKIMFRGFNDDNNTQITSFDDYHMLPKLRIDIEVEPHSSLNELTETNHQLKLRCNSNGDKPVEIQWEIEKHRGYDMEEVHDATIIIAQLSADDLGAYRCIGTNDQGSSTKSIQIKRNEANELMSALSDYYLLTPIQSNYPSIDIRFLTQTLEIREGDPIEIECLSSSPAIWKLDESSDHDIVIDKKRLVIASFSKRKYTNRLLCQAESRETDGITEVHISFEPREVYQSGLLIYQIAVSHRSYYSSLSTDVSQESTTKTVEEPPQLQLKVLSTVDDLENNRQVKIECVSDSLTDRIEWHRPDDKKFTSNVRIERGLFLIAPITAEDVGVYYCSTSNSIGNGEIRFYLERKYVDFGRYKFEYHMSKPISWLQDEMKSTYPVIVDTTTTTEKMTRKQATIAHFNGRKRGISINFDFNPTNPQDISLGKQLTVECLADYDIHTKIRWQRISDHAIGFSPETLDEGPLLQFKPLTVEQLGSYECITSNTREQTQSSAVLNIDKETNGSIIAYMEQFINNKQTREDDENESYVAPLIKINFLRSMYPIPAGERFEMMCDGLFSSSQAEWKTSSLSKYGVNIAQNVFIIEPFTDTALDLVTCHAQNDDNKEYSDVKILFEKIGEDYQARIHSTTTVFGNVNNRDIDSLKKLPLLIIDIKRQVSTTYIQRGEHLTIDCHSDISLLKPSWNISTNLGNELKELGTITINDVSTKNIGFYNCSIQNEYGTTYAALTFNLRTKDTFFIDLYESTTSVAHLHVLTAETIPGGNMKVLCEVEGNEESQWFYEGSPVMPPIANVTGRLLNIKIDDRSDSTFSCKTNQHGSTEIQIHFSSTLSNANGYINRWTITPANRNESHKIVSYNNIKTISQIQELDQPLMMPDYTDGSVPWIHLNIKSGWKNVFKNDQLIIDCNAPAEFKTQWYQINTAKDRVQLTSNGTLQLDAESNDLIYECFTINSEKLTEKIEVQVKSHDTYYEIDFPELKFINGIRSPSIYEYRMEKLQLICPVQDGSVRWTKLNNNEISSMVVNGNMLTLTNV